MPFLMFILKPPFGVLEFATVKVSRFGVKSNLRLCYLVSINFCSTFGRKIVNITILRRVFRKRKRLEFKLQLKVKSSLTLRNPNNSINYKLFNSQERFSLSLVSFSVKNNPLCKPLPGTWFVKFSFTERIYYRCVWMWVRKGGIYQALTRGLDKLKEFFDNEQVRKTNWIFGHINFQN